MIAKPFRAVRPAKDLAEQVNVPPYDVVSAEEVKKAVAGNPHSFFHITRAECDIPDLKDEHAMEVYQKARENFLDFINKGTLRRDSRPCYYLLSQTWHGRTQTGIYAAVSCEEYNKNLIRKHELTRKDKEEDRTNHIETVGAGTGPVFLAFDAPQAFLSMSSQVRKGVPEYELTDENTVENKLWVIDEEKTVKEIEDIFRSVPAFYIADGHHRAASAANVWRKKKELPGHSGNEGYNFFMAVLFPSSELEILSYNRVVLDLNGISEEGFFVRIMDQFEVHKTDLRKPSRKGEIIFYINKQFFLLNPRPGTFDRNNPLESLDVSILQKNLLAPVLGIDDPRTSKRIQFVGGIKGTEELVRLVDTGAAAAAFAMYPVSMQELMAITNANLIMPPKSTWFEPKLRDGLVTYTLE